MSCKLTAEDVAVLGRVADLFCGPGLDDYFNTGIAGKIRGVISRGVLDDTAWSAAAALRVVLLDPSLAAGLGGVLRHHPEMSGAGELRPQPAPEVVVREVPTRVDLGAGPVYGRVTMWPLTLDCAAAALMRSSVSEDDHRVGMELAAVAGQLRAMLNADAREKAEEKVRRAAGNAAGGAAGGGE